MFFVQCFQFDPRASNDVEDFSQVEREGKIEGIHMIAGESEQKKVVGEGVCVRETVLHSANAVQCCLAALISSDTGRQSMSLSLSNTAQHGARL